MFTSKTDVSLLPASHCLWTAWLLACLKHLVPPVINTQSYISPWLCGLNLEHRHMGLCFSFQTDHADMGRRNFICTFEMQTYKDNAPKSTNLVSVVNKEIYLLPLFFLFFRGDFINKLRMLKEFTSLQGYLALLLWWSTDCTMISEEAALYRGKIQNNRRIRIIDHHLR